MKKKGNVLVLHKILIFSINRVMEFKTEKNSKTFDFPFELDTGSILINESKRFRLLALIAQQGSALGGHYVCYRLDDHDRWIKANDSRMTWLSKQEVERLFRNNPFVATMLIFAVIK